MKCVLWILFCLSDYALSNIDYTDMGCDFSRGMIGFCAIDMCQANGVLPCPACSYCDDRDLGICMVVTDCCSPGCDYMTENCNAGTCVTDDCGGTCTAACEYCGESTCDIEDCNDCDESCEGCGVCESCECGGCKADKCCINGDDISDIACGDFQEISALACHSGFCGDTCVGSTTAVDEDHCLGLCSMNSRCAGYTWYPDHSFCELLDAREPSDCQHSCIDASDGSSTTCTTKMNFKCAACFGNICRDKTANCYNPAVGIGQCFESVDELGGDRKECYGEPCQVRGIFGDPPPCPPEKQMECGLLDMYSGKIACVCTPGHYHKCEHVDDAFEYGVVWSQSILDNSRTRGWIGCRLHCLDHGKCRHFAYFGGTGKKQGHCKLYASAINKTGFRKTWRRSTPEFTEFYFGAAPAAPVLLSVVEHDLSGLKIKDMPLPGSCKPHEEISACGKGDKYCYCTPDCEEHLDCCEDYYEFCGNGTKQWT